MTTSTAISAQGTSFSIATGSGSAKTVSSVTAGYPTKINATSHGFSAGDRVTIAGTSGATGLNAEFTVKYALTNSFMVDLDTTGDTISVSSATATPVTWSTIANVKSVKGPDGSAKEIDVSHLASDAVEVVLGLQDNGNITLEIDRDDSDAGQQALQTAKEDTTKQQFKIVLPAGTTPTATFYGYVKKFDVGLGVNDVVKRSCDIRVSGAVTWS